MFKKNTAITGFPFALVSATDGSAITSGTVTGYYLLDGGTQGTVTGTPVHEGNGQWSVDLLAAELNGDIVGLTFTHSSAIPASFTIKTDTKIVSELNDISSAEVNSQCDTAIADSLNSIADAILNRDFSAVSDTNARTLLNAARFLRNKYSVSGTTLTVTKEDDTTSAWTSALTVDASANPVTGSDPA